MLSASVNSIFEDFVSSNKKLNVVTLYNVLALSVKTND